MFRRPLSHRRSSPQRSSRRRARVARTSRSRPARRAMLLTRRAKLSAARRPRRGVLLLVVLSLLVLFLMVGTAFVITAKQAEKTAKSSMKAAIRVSTEAAQADLLDEVLRQIIRDTNNPHSSLRFHSLLGDMYGNDGLKTRVAAANWASALFDGTNPTGGQILELALDTSTARDLAGVEIDAYGNLFVPPASATDPAPPRFGPYDNAYNGQVLTFLSGPARGRSTRIVGFIPPNRLRVMNFNIEDGTPVSDPTAQIPEMTRILINGRPFSGTGFGFNRAAANEKLNLFERLSPVGADPTIMGELALLPNSQFLNVSVLRQARATDATPFVSAGFLLSGAQLAQYYDPMNPNHVAKRLELAANVGPAGIGGANESYDAVDFQNMALALVPGVDVQLAETVVSVTDLANESFQLPQVLSVIPPIGTGPALPPHPMIIPSWHRPELINYWANHTSFANKGSIRFSKLASNLDDRVKGGMTLRRILLRPNWLDHPNFTGSNPEFAAIPDTNNETEYGQKLARMIYGPWDVDNDNDGVRDSVWVDVGLPVMAGPNGKLVKPLAAIMIVDMDGRLNVNAHGTCDLAEVGASVSLTDPNNAQLGVMADGTNRANATPRGMGYGPADISLERAIGDEDFFRLLTGRYESSHANASNPVTWNNGRPVGPGRYGQDDQNSFRPGRQLQYDLISQIERAGWPEFADGNTVAASQAGFWIGSAFATPPDLRARYGLGLDYFGQPIFEATLSTELGDRANPWKNLVADSPYELNLSQKTAAGVQGYATGANAPDAPFALAELERLLRAFDADAGSLPSRLAYLSGVLQADNSSGNGFSDRSRLTTDSYDLPVPNVALPHEMAGLVASNARLPRSTAELFEIRVRAALFPNDQSKWFPATLADDPSNPLSDAKQVRAVMRRILAPELADGLRLNVNRPLGNGVDDNENGVVDEPGESNSRAWSASLPNDLSAFSAPTFPDNADDVITDPTNGTVTVGKIDHRQYLARHLYVLALTLTAESHYNPLGLPNRPPRPAGSDAAKMMKSDRMLARTLAQWAVNVVDFRDHDNIMTGFEYDPDPFDGWGMPNAPRKIMDGDLATIDDQFIVGGDPKTNSEDRAFVWGAERPELLMTETLAWHDRRTDDSAQEQPYPDTDKATTTDAAPTQNPDFDYDQRRRPRGAAFIELYNPWAASPAVSADTHRVAVQGGSRVDLGVDLAATDKQTGNSPVWRMMIYKRPSDQRAQAVMNWNPDDPAHLPRAGIGRRAKDVLPDRSVYFAGFDPAQVNDKWDNHGRAFFNQMNSTGASDLNGPNNPVPPVRPERYLVVGSGDDFTGTGVYENFIGDRRDNDDNIADDQPGGANAKPRRGIDLVVRRDNNPPPTAVRMKDDDGQPFRDPTTNLDVVAPPETNGITQRLAGDDSNSIADVAIIDQVYDMPDGYNRRETGYDAADKVEKQRRRRFTFSEPANGYPAKFRGSRWVERPGKEGQYLDKDGNPAAIDVPLDGPLGGIDETQFNAQYPVPYYLNDADQARGIIGESGTSPDPRITYSFIYLQRLANPLLPWNPEPAQGADPTANGHRPDEPVNPYLTIDTTTANVTVFNGRDIREKDNSPAADDKKNGYVSVRLARPRFASLQRGYHASKNAQGEKVATLFGWELPSSDRDSKSSEDESVIRLRRPPNNVYADLVNNNSHYFNTVPYHTLGFLNKPFQDTAATGLSTVVKPVKPFSWMTWNNRPYISGNELMVAPKLSPSLLLREFTSAENKANDWSPYEPPTEQEDDLVRRGVFDHLLSFFYEELEGQNPPPVAPGVPLHMYRVLEYVHTPSLYAGTQTWANPTAFSTNAMAAVPPADYVNDPRFGRQAPFNAISEFRDPGRINLNTVFSKDVWEGIFHGDTRPDAIGDIHPGPIYEDEATDNPPRFVRHRRGYGNNAADIHTLTMNPSFPTFFAQPYRSPDAGNLVPLSNLVKAGVDGTLLRRVPGEPRAGTPEYPLFSATTDRLYNNADRHPYFTFGPMVRLDNLVTTRSNVYAVWVTIGFFEVDEAPDYAEFRSDNGLPDDQATQLLYKQVYPEGYRFGREDGVDLGNVRRLRGFYIIDRTQMAGFEPGADHNVENVVRLRRRIE